MNNTGFIKHEDFVIAMTTRGDKLPETAVRTILSDPAFNPGGNGDKFDYVAFCRQIVATTNELARLAVERARKIEEHQALNSKTYKVAKKSPKKSKWSEVSRSKGAFYFEADNVISHQFVFRVAESGRFEIAMEKATVDSQFFLFKILVNGNDSDFNSSPERKLKLVARSALLLPDLGEAESWNGFLEKGAYFIVPTTSGCLLKRRKSQPLDEKSLVEKAASKVILTDDFKRVLGIIYSQVDLDGNGSLSRIEFNLFNWRTSGEEVQDEEWDVVKDNFALKNGELTLDGFLQLHQMEAEDNGGDSAELWITLNAMGFNARLEQDEAAAYEIAIRAEDKGQKAPLTVSGLRSGGVALDKACIKCVIDASNATEIAANVFLYREDSPTLSSFVLQNRSDSEAAVSLDFEGSQNVLINHPHFKFTTRLSPKSTLFAAQIVPASPSQQHSIYLNHVVM